MRDATGATMVFSICLTFTIMMTAYLAISVNYAKAFRIKNYIVSKIEENEGYTGALEMNLEDYFENQGYLARGRCANAITVPGYDDGWTLSACVGRDATGLCGACIYRLESSTGGASGLCANRAKYRVLSFFKFDVPVAGALFTFQVGGESRYIYDFANSARC